MLVACWLRAVGGWWLELVWRCLVFSLVEMRRKSRAETDVEKVVQAFSQACEMTLAIKDEPYPYAVMVNYAPYRKGDELYLVFHGAKQGRKYELLQQDGRCAASILLRTEVQLLRACESTNFFCSLCAEGTVEFWDGEEALEALEVLMLHHGYEDPEEELKAQMAPMLKKTQVFALKVERAGLKENRPH